MRMTKSKVVSLIKVIAFLLVLVLCTGYVSQLLKDKNNYLKYSLFYTEKEPFDVLFFGSSRMLNAVYPMELWDEYGITSYNMAQHSENLRVTYWQMKNAFEHNKPQVAVVDVSLFTGGEIMDDDQEAKSYLHKSLDHVPLGKLKYDALKDLTVDVDMLEYLFPLVIYHNRWNELERNDVYMVPSGQKGAEMRVNVEPMERMAWSSEEIAKKFDTEGIKLDAIVSLCEEYEVDLVLTCMPTIWTSGNPGVCSDMNYIKAYAEERGLHFLNFAKEDHMINYAVDFYDLSHLNPSGARKVTDSLGAFLAAHWEMSLKSESTVNAWEKSLYDYRAIKRSKLVEEKNAGDLIDYLMLLNDNDYSFEIKIKDAGLLETMGLYPVLGELDMDVEDMIPGLEEGAVQITVYDSVSNEMIDTAVFE